MSSLGMDLIYERYKASPNYISKELLDYLCNEQEFCNFCQFCGPKKTYFYTNSSLKLHYRLRHSQEILKYFPDSKLENAVDVKTEELDEDDNESITLSLNEASKEIVIYRVTQIKIWLFKWLQLWKYSFQTQCW